MQEILSTGKLDIIRDEKIKTTIQKHYAQIRRQTYLQRLMERNRDMLTDYLRDKNISVSNDLDEQEFIAKLGNPERLITMIENFVHISIVVHNGITLNNNSILKKTNRLIQTIEKYLEQNKSLSDEHI